MSNLKNKTSAQFWSKRAKLVGLCMLAVLTLASRAVADHGILYWVLVPPGFSMIANQLNYGSNTVAEVLRPGLGVIEGTMLYKVVTKPELPEAIPPRHRHTALDDEKNSPLISAQVGAAQFDDPGRAGTDASERGLSQTAAAPKAPSRWAGSRLALRVDALRVATIRGPGEVTGAAG